MRRRHDRRTSPSIDLTPLLDVIFILLFSVMMTNGSANDKRAAELDARERNISQKEQEAENAKSEYENMTETVGHIAEYVYIVSVSAFVDDTDVSKRTIKISSVEETGEETETYELVGADTEAYKKMSDYLEQYINDHKDSPVILALNPDDDKILYRDEREITEILMGLMEEYGNVSVKGNIGDHE